MYPNHRLQLSRKTGHASITKHNLDYKILPQPIFLILVHRGSTQHISGYRACAGKRIFAVKSGRIQTQTRPWAQRKRKPCAPLTPVVTVTLMSALGPGEILQASCGSRQTRLREPRVNHGRHGGDRPGLDRKEAGFSALLPDSHAGAQWAAMAREQAPRDRHRHSHLSWKKGLTSLQRVSKITGAIKHFPV